MVKTQNLVSKFLRELNSNEVKESLDSLNFLVEHLETINDPSPTEIQIVDAAYQTLEKLKLLEGMLKNYREKSLPSNKLSSLYEQKPTNVGTQVLFD